MSDEPTQIPTDAPAPVGATRVEGPAEPSSEPSAVSNATAQAAEVVDEHPEYAVAGAFAGAFIVAKILRRIGGGIGLMAQEPTPSPSELGRALQQVTDLSQKIIHEEIELAKAEVAMKVTKLAKGAAVGAAAGVFAIFGLIFLLHGLAWLLWQLIGGETSFWLGFALVALILFILAGVAGFLAFKFVKGGAPPTPQMAIDEAQKVRATISSGKKS